MKITWSYDLTVMEIERKEWLVIAIANPEQFASCQLYTTLMKALSSSLSVICDNR